MLPLQGLSRILQFQFFCHFCSKGEHFRMAQQDNNYSLTAKIWKKTLIICGIYMHIRDLNVYEGLDKIVSKRMHPGIVNLLLDLRIHSLHTILQSKKQWNYYYLLLEAPSIILSFPCNSAAAFPWSSVIIISCVSQYYTTCIQAY